jgi:hypothetical protein
MAKPTPQQIAAEIAALEKAKTYAPARTMFGDDNHAKIDRQIEYLRGEIDMDSDEWNDLSEAEQSAVLEAQAWQDGDSEETLSSGWDIFKPKSA